jgi:hypothetical protein
MFKIGDRVVCVVPNTCVNGGMRGVVVGYSAYASLSEDISFAVAFDGFTGGHCCGGFVYGDSNNRIPVVDKSIKNMWFCDKKELVLESEYKEYRGMKVDPTSTMVEDALKSTLGKSKEESSREYFIGRFPKISKIIRSSGRTGHPITIVILKDGRKGIVRLQEGDVDNFDVAVLYAYIKAKEKKVVVIDRAHQRLVRHPLHMSNSSRGILLRGGESKDQYSAWLEESLRSSLGGRRNGK